MNIRTIIIVTVTFMITSIFGGLMMRNLNQAYLADKEELVAEIRDRTDRINELNEEIDYLEDQNAKLNNQIDEMEEQVWNIMNGEDYEITIHHDDQIHIWSSEGDGWFKDVSHWIVY